MNDYLSYSAIKLGGLIQSKQIGVAELTRAAIEAAKESNDGINAFITINEEEAIRQARRVQSLIDNGDTPSKLAGVPCAVKDNISTRGTPTTCASRILGGYTPMYDATVVERLRAAGTVMIGKLNMDEFAMGSTTETSAYGSARNPWDPSRCPGGSSGGAAAAVAARVAPFTLGSDTGGSIRQPAAFCGVTGFKPTYGAVSRWGLIAYGSSLDQIGPIAKDARDCAAVMTILSGEDKRDGTSTPFEFDDSSIANVNADSADLLVGLRVGVPDEAFETGLDPSVRARTLEAADTLSNLGAAVERFSFPMFKYAVPAYYIIASAEAASNLSRYDGIRYGRGVAEPGLPLDEAIIRARSEGFGREVKRRLMLGNFALSAGYYDAYYNKALQAKALLCGAFDAAFDRFDILLTPTAPTTAMRLGESLDDPLTMYLGDIYTVPVNLAGLPAVSLPCGFSDKDGMPVGMQFIGKAFSDVNVLRAAAAYQSATDWHQCAPVSAAKGGAAYATV
ncbi:MAG: Asp-tRNA(Asn)/Glu-tRNA(Gln) amidotransferase subunit GatA [Oscillospiraceae bacterium]|jgi:aspartyl-tRNA(Asn)/glutamyl-tRNA(Gln) amidotransferase subunit A|nr:Asp-tRNA(Asn)/Glu-tRNA(Gln) amidotransferase subunit GatA [Oscillospiraceae bacterium]